MFGQMCRKAAKTMTGFAVNIAVNAVKKTVDECEKGKEELEGIRGECNALFVEPRDLNAVAGDMIEIERKPYSHWVLYVGDGNVIHLTGPFDNDQYKYVLGRLSDVVEGSVCRVNNMETVAKRRGLVARSAEVIVKAAYAKLDQTEDYHIFENNCEHFVTECRFGQRFSLQGELADDKPMVSTIGPAIGRFIGASSMTNPIPAAIPAVIPIIKSI